MDAKTLVFFGKSGSGKGTQAKLLIDCLKEKGDKEVLYMETGARLRDFTLGDGLSNKLTKEVMEHGKLMPEFLPVWIWSDFLLKQYTGNEHLILDGVSRRIHEASILTSAFKFYGVKNPHIVYLNTSRQFSYDLMKARGRKDDTDEYINSRLDWFEKEVLPVIEHFRSDPYYTFLDINGERSIEEVHQDIVKQVCGEEL
ncbi:MAG: hypothetical protein A2408_01785 [Candidatus Yonathbacteria bacterium RIFOXYC1_FULL_52_10]|uniref:Adenylate kinase n=1 Tax=Candidatus Yonathbacteria bacterium RIFOXYD1_FULL_52_36 TaxID=1802730 RepID=A0A1G2SIR5_9BACT|nr:MAG: hypothetical protein A2408_01785 [Candidatus Yonathbacteria bacterium RIFOXYC1_FULL_52_10]OHA84864.1 MAG: hypothetical protein A2591_00880 [Candidatus Yonathbacteria bacterium RIFOXYD1_FULL_52_36]